ncbi:acyltransferase [Oribacterium sp. NK2B42]|uniref:acyltransferase n=1 Tax=Oribacterium sp. NK2B42 TaxID=689781 RepID=UPI000677F8CA|nr:acyltransferase [Oribacterium sp. NK2B42]
MKQSIKKLLKKPARFIARRIQKFKYWIYKWWGVQRSRYFGLVFAECGTHLKVNGKPLVFQPHKIHVGDHFTINNGAQIAPRGEVYIGDYVTMSRGSQITAGSLDTSQWVNGQYKDHIHKQEDVYIGEGTWMGVNSIVLAGVHITGKGVVIAAGAVVTHDFTEDYVIIGGVPARIIKDLKIQ